MPNRKLTIATLAVAGVLGLSLSLNAYFIRRDIGGWALWNSKEAYLFIGHDTRGYHVKWIGYPLLAAGEALGHIESPDDDRGAMYVIRVTPERVERYVIELPDRRPGSGPSMYTPLDGRIWANWPTIGGLCWWAGDHFEPASPEEKQRLEGLIHLRNDAYRDQAGWSADGIWTGFIPAIQVGDKFELRGGSEGITSEHGTFSLEMHKQGSEPTTVLSIDGSSGRVSANEYRRSFHDPE